MSSQHTVPTKYKQSTNSAPCPEALCPTATTAPRVTSQVLVALSECLGICNALGYHRITIDLTALSAVIITEARSRQPRSLKAVQRRAQTRPFYNHERALAEVGRFSFRLKYLGSSTSELSVGGSDAHQVFIHGILHRTGAGPVPTLRPAAHRMRPHSVNGPVLTVLTDIGFRILHFACSHRTVLRQDAYRASHNAEHGPCCVIKPRFCNT